MATEKYSLGDQVKVEEGPMKGIPGIVIYIDAKRDRYLLRFTGMQQVYFTEDQIHPWR